MRPIPPQSIAARLESSTRGETSETPLSADLYHTHCRRLAAVSLIYVIGYTLAWGSSFVTRIVEI